MLFIYFLFIFFPRKKRGKNEIEGRKIKEEGKYLGERVIIRGIGVNNYGSCD